MAGYTQESQLAISSYFFTYKCYNYTTYIYRAQGRCKGEEKTAYPWPVHRKHNTTLKYYEIT